MSKMPRVRTSDGYLVPWDRRQIVDRLVKETKLAEEMFDLAPMGKRQAGRIAKIVEEQVGRINPQFVSAPMIREMVNNVLLDLSAEKPEFAIYRNVLTRVGASVYDAFLMDTGNGYESHENANLQHNPETSHKKKADHLSKEEYLLLMPPGMAESHHKGDIHIHTLEYFGSRPFCQDWDLRYLFKYGFIADGSGFHGSVAKPAKHASVAMLHSVKALAAGQLNFSGGQGFMNYTVFMAPYLKGMKYDEIKQIAQMMFYELTQTYITRGGQPVFSSLQLPMGVPNIWKDVPIVRHGKVGPDTYGDYEDEVQLFFRAICEVALEGDGWGKPFNFPKMENYVSPEFFKSEYDDLWLLVHEIVAKHGSPYFDNMIPKYRGYGNGLSCYQCCAYQFANTPETDPNFEEKLYFEDGQHFSMGGWQVVSINMPRLAYRSNGDYDMLLQLAKENMRLAIDIFKVKRQWMNRLLKNDHLAYATQQPRDPSTGNRAPPLVDFSELVYVMGVVGINEMVKQVTGYELHEDKDAVKLALKLLLDMEKFRRGLQMQNGMKLSLARTPAESTAQTFAVKDLMAPEYKKKAKKIVQGDLSAVVKGERDLPVYYTNGTHTNVSANISFGEKVDIEHKFFPILSGGNIFHAWMGETHPDPEGMYKLTKRLVESSQIGYFTYTKDLTVCPSCQSTSGGLLDKCQICGESNVRWWSRITGYYTDVSGWNKGKKQELRDRYKLGF